MSLGLNPLTNDVVTLKNVNAINRSVRNLIATNRGERFFNPSLGCGIERLLFEPIDQITSQSVREEIEITLQNFEPRIELLGVDVNPNYDTNELNVTIKYNVIGADIPRQELSFALQPTR